MIVVSRLAFKYDPAHLTQDHPPVILRQVFHFQILLSPEAVDTLSEVIQSTGKHCENFSADNLLNAAVNTQTSHH